MKVSLVDYTGAGTSDPASYAASVLIFTKNTRLLMSPALLTEILSWSHPRKMKELEYMAHTLPSSHEFVHFTFLIEGVTRAFTHQLVRTRNASYAQQAMRILNVKGWEYDTGPTIQACDPCLDRYKEAMNDIATAYDYLIEHGAAVEDARGVLPTNILTNIVMGINMRNFVALIKKRSGPRIQSEYRGVLDQMKDLTTGIYPWLSLFIDRTKDRALSDLDKEIIQEPDPTKRMRMMKLVDQVRTADVDGD
jgi:flavin-dependent thymidylate synthase